MEKTIYDVAKEAGVSIATVSKVINEKGRISEKTSKHVKDVMKRLNYQPSSIASALTKKRTYTIGLIVPNIANPFFGEVTSAIEKHARELGYTTMVCSTYNNTKVEIENIKLFLRQQVDGLIIATEQISDEKLEQFNTRNIPIVKFSAFKSSSKMIGISTDNYLGGQMAAKYLYSKAHRDIWIVGETTRHSEMQRINGFQNYFLNKSIEIKDSQIFHSNTEYSTVISLAEYLFQQPKLPSAMFVTTDIVASILMNEAKKNGLDIPNDLSVVGFDNTLIAKLNEPALTTIAQPVGEMAIVAVKALIDILEGQLEAPYDLIYFEPKLIERNTVQALKE